MVLEKLSIRPRGVRVRNHDVGLYGLSVRKLDAAGPSVFNEDPAHLSVAAHGTAVLLDETNESAHESAGAAFRIMNAVFALQMRDEAIIGSGRERVSADEKGVEAENDLQLVVGEEI